MSPQNTAFITITTEGEWSLLRGGPAEPLQQAARLAGVELRWGRSDHAWIVRTDQVADVVAAGELLHLVVVRRAS
jgi:hypothetical protein